MEDTIEQVERDTTDEERLVHSWRTTQLERLGVSHIKAEMFAGHVDWHKIAELIQRGCSPDLALDIVR